MGRVHEQWLEGAAEWRENTRLRWGVFAVLIIVLIYGIEMTQDLAASLRAEVSALMAKDVRLQNIKGQEGWPAVVEQAESHLANAARHLWAAETPGLAQATLQGWLSDLLEEAPVKGRALTVNVAEATEGDANLWRVRGEMRGEMAQRDFLNLLQAIETHPRRVQVVQMQWTLSRLGVRASLQVEALFERETGG